MIRICDMKVIRHHAVGQELHARKPRDAPDEVHQPRTPLVVKKERTMGNTTNQVVTPVGKIDAATSHAGNYTTNKIYCGNLLWQSSLTLPNPITLLQGNSSGAMSIRNAVTRLSKQ